MSEVLKFNDLTLKIEENPADIRISWEGKSTERDPARFLSPVLSSQLEKHKKLVMDFTHLQYMNSSTVTPILKLIEQISHGQGQLEIVFDRQLKWQELSFSALEIFKTPDQRILISGI